MLANHLAFARQLRPGQRQQHRESNGPAQHVESDGRDNAGDTPPENDVPRPEQGDETQQQVGMNGGPACRCGTIHGSPPGPSAEQQIPTLYRYIGLLPSVLGSQTMRTWLDRRWVSFSSGNHTSPLYCHDVAHHRFGIVCISEARRTPRCRSDQQSAEAESIT